MISFLKIPRDSAERMYLLGANEHHRNWWPESVQYAERRKRRQMRVWMNSEHGVKSPLARGLYESERVE